jgi:hypothetical protein
MPPAPSSVCPQADSDEIVGGLWTHTYDIQRDASSPVDRIHWERDRGFLWSQTTNRRPIRHRTGGVSLTTGEGRSAQTPVIAQGRAERVK